MVRLGAGVIALAALAFALAHANRIPGDVGEMIRANIETGRDATALFYTEVNGWDEWAMGNDGAASRLNSKNPIAGPRYRSLR